MTYSEKIKNRIYRLNKKIDKSPLTFLFLLVSVIIPNLLIIFSGKLQIMALSGVLIWMVIGLFTLFRVKYINRTLKFNKSEYTIPEAGEIIQITKGFWKGSRDDLKIYKKFPDPKKVGVYFIMEQEAKVESVKYIDGDWELYIRYGVNFGANGIKISYFDSRSNWTTKKDIRDNKLKSIGI